MNTPIMHELALHEYLREQLAEQFLDADEESLNDTLEGLTNLHEILGAVVRSQQEDRVLFAALKARIEEMQKRLKRLEYKIDKKRDLVTTVMERARIKKIVEADVTVSLRQTARPLVITDEGAIPEAYWQPQPPKLDRRKLIDDLKGSLPVAGACLGNGGQTISVRVQ